MPTRHGGAETLAALELSATRRERLRAKAKHFGYDRFPIWRRATRRFGNCDRSAAPCGTRSSGGKRCVAEIRCGRGGPDRPAILRAPARELPPVRAGIDGEQTGIVGGDG